MQKMYCRMQEKENNHKQNKIYGPCSHHHHHHQHSVAWVAFWPLPEPPPNAKGNAMGSKAMEYAPGLYLVSVGRVYSC